MEFSRCFVHQVARCKFMSSFQLKSIFFTICWLGQMCSRLKLFSFLWRIWEWQIWSPIWLIHSRPSEWFQGKLVSDIFVVFSLYSKLILVKNLHFFAIYFPKMRMVMEGGGVKGQLEESAPFKSNEYFTKNQSRGSDCYLWLISRHCQVQLLQRFTFLETGKLAGLL